MVRPRPHTSAPPAFAFLLLGVLGALLGGCGRKATEADCTLILDRNVEVAMRAINVTDLASIQKRKDEIRGEMKSDMKDCVGRRITDGMLACVRKAATADGIDACMR